MMTSISPRFNGLSLTDELAEATNELLDLGKSSHRVNRPGPSLRPLPTPSPLNLGSGTPTLSSVLSVNNNAKLTLIYDDDDGNDDDVVTRSDEQRTDFRSGSVDQDQAAEMDGDDHLPSSQLNRLVASVSKMSNSASDSSLSHNLRKVDEAIDAHDWHKKHHEKRIQTSSRTASASDEVYSQQAPSSTRSERVPDFFTESFPEARDARATDAEGSSSKAYEAGMVKSSSSSSAFGLGLPVTQPTKATLGDVHESSIIVKLHGNKRLEREAKDYLNEEQEQEINSQSPKPEDEDGETSSLLSLPATSITTSSQNSSRGRRRPIRRRSNGSTSLTIEDVETVDETPFARDVQIRGFNVVGEKSRGFVCYDVRIITTRGTTIGILRRFSSFCQLRASLISERPQYSSLVPPLPPRGAGLLHKYASHHLEKRRRALQKWLAIVMLDRKWGTTNSLREWVVGSSN